MVAFGVAGVHPPSHNAQMGGWIGFQHVKSRTGAFIGKYLEYIN
jgi:hypothetical protein